MAGMPPFKHLLMNHIAKIVPALLTLLILTDCAPHMGIPPDDATPDAVATAFLESVRVGDQQAAQHLSGDCWNTTQAWFNRNKKKSPHSPARASATPGFPPGKRSCS